jgi:hypothetical protein
MWPSENAIKTTLSGTKELIFDPAGCLTLNEKIVLAKSLDSALIVSAIHALNAIFEQEEKLALARQLRNYISSCHYQDQLKSEKLSLWHNFTCLLSSPRLAFTAFSVLFVVFPCLLVWPIIVSCILISPFLLIPPCLWFMQRLNYRLAEIAQIKDTKVLTALIDAADHSEPLINPLFIRNENKLFEENAPQEIQSFPSLTADSLSEKLALLCGNQNLKTSFNRHIGTISSYSQKASLKDALQCVYRRLKGDLDKQLGPLPEKAMLKAKLIEGIHTCTPGFHNRVNTILESFNQPQNFSELLYLVRKHLVEKATLSLRDNDVHTANRVTVIANTDGLGIKPNFAEDIYPGYVSDQAIRLALQCEFKNNYTLFNLSTLLADTLRGLLIEVGYSGVKEEAESYTIGSPDSEVDKFTVLIKKYLTSTDFQNFNWINFFIIDEETSLILDINWEFIKQCFFKQLLKENYFAIPSFDDFCKNLSPLLTYKNKQDWNYLMLLAHYPSASLSLLFYYLRAYPNSVTEEIKVKLIRLFFEKNKMGQNAVQLAAQHHPDSLIVLLDFIDEHIDQFDLDFNGFMLAEKYHPESLKIILDFTEKHLTPADKKTIRAFFLQKNAIGWNTFIHTTYHQPKTALTILNYIIKHPEMFITETAEDKSLFAENLAKIQQGLSNLIAIEKPDSERINTLLKFMSLYPELLANTPKKLADFIFKSLAIIHDKKLIDAIFVSHAPLLLNYFSTDYFTTHRKNLATIIEKLLCAYSAELTTRKSNNIIYTTKFFKQPVGYSTDEKLQALHSLLGVLENCPDFEKKDKLNSLKTSHPALANGRLNQFFKACRYNDAVTQQIKIAFNR